MKYKPIDYHIIENDFILGKELQNISYSEITARIIDTTKDSIKLLVSDSKTDESADEWYNKKSINDFWQLVEGRIKKWN